MDQLLTDVEVRRILGVSRTTLYRIRKLPDSKLRARKINGKIGYLKSEVVGFLSSLPIADSVA